MLTTVVGSYPSPPRKPASFGSKISSFLGNYDPYQAAVEFAVEQQILAGINLSLIHIYLLIHLKSNKK